MKAQNAVTITMDPAATIIIEVRSQPADPHIAVVAIARVWL